MKAVIQYDEYAHPPLMRMYIHGCPHKRQQREVIQQFREELLYVAKRSIGNVVDFPIDHPIDLELVLTNPSSPDLDHLLEAVYMAMDGKSMKGASILTDDRHIQSVKLSKMYTEKPTKRDGAR